MPWTRRQVRFLESKVSPLTSAQKDKMNSELHSDPSLGHKKKGSASMAKEPTSELHHMEIHPAENGGHVVEHHFKPKMQKSGAFMEHKEPEKHVFGPTQGAKMVSHLKEHLGIGAAPAAKSAGKELEPAEHEPQTAEMEEEEQEGE